MPDDDSTPRPTPSAAARANRTVPRPDGRPARVAGRPRRTDGTAGTAGTGRTSESVELHDASGDVTTDVNADVNTDLNTELNTDAGTTPAPLPSGSRAGRNLPAAIGVGLGLGAVVLVSLFAYRPSFAILVGIVLLYGCYELSVALRAAGIRITLLPVLVGGAATLVAAWERGPSGLVLAVLVTVVGILAWRIGDGADGYGRDVGASALTLLYVPTLGAFAILLVHPHDGAARVLVFVATVVCSDTGGYAAGVLFGRHPLAPIVSKAKTWEGFAGSVVACAVCGIVFFTLCFHEQWWKGLLFGLAVVVTATLGDLGESMIKRDLGIKDMGRLLPGHGGIMDRLDSLLPCAAVAYLVLAGLAPH